MKRNLRDMWIFSIKGRSGSVSVFLMLVLAAMVGLAMAMIAAGNRTASTGMADSLFGSAGRSVLAEYDRGLKEDFGIFAFRGSAPEIEEKLSFYVNYTLDGYPKMNMTKIEADTGEYSLMNVELFRKEIIGHAKFAAARGFIKDDILKSGGGEGKEVSSSTGSLSVSGEKRDYVLRNSAVIDGLPSKELGKGGSLWKKIRDSMSGAGDVFKKGGEGYWINKYIMLEFKNAQNDPAGRDTFFNYEAEYILEGNYSDESNRKEFRKEVKALRNAVDFAFIFSDPKMMAEVTALAATIAPGPGAAAAEAALAETWALAEAENDWNILEHGGKVPLYKTKGTWAVDLKSAVKDSSGGYIDTHAKSGLTYSGYLQTFLFFENSTVKTARIMDLIQINLKGTRNREFLIKECNLGFMFDAGVNGRSFRYAHKY